MNEQILKPADPEIPEGITLSCSCSFDPDGNWLFICDEHQNALTVYLRTARQVFKLQVLGDSNKMREA